MVIVESKLTLLDDCDSNTGWASDGDAIAAYSGFQRQGSACLGMQNSEETGHAYQTISATDLTSTRIYAWVQVWGDVDTAANGGFRVVLGDGNVRRAYYVGGSDSFGFQVGAWVCLVLEVAADPGSGLRKRGTLSDLKQFC